MPSAEWDLVAEAAWWADFAWQNKEIVAGCAALALPMLMAFTRKQRDWIRDRDNHQSQMRHYNEEQGFHTSPERPGDKPQVHHILPQAMGGEDSPYNGLTIWEREHTGKGAKKGEFVVHPDNEEWRRTYYKGKKFDEVQKARKEKIAKGEVFWNDAHDEEMLQTARERTDNYIMSGHPWPKKKGGKKK